VIFVSSKKLKSENNSCRNDIPKTDPSEIEVLIQRLKQSNLDPHDGAELKFEIKSIAGSYEGKINPELTTISGTWSQMERSIPA
jgi:hypothetical protein